MGIAASSMGIFYSPLPYPNSRIPTIRDEIRGAGHMRAVTEKSSIFAGYGGFFLKKNHFLEIPGKSRLGASNWHRKLQGHH